MSAFSRQLRQCVTAWNAPVNDGFGGFSFAAPASMAGRWQDVQEIFTNPAGEEQLSSAIVYPAEDVAIGGYLYLGESAASDPTTVSGARRVEQFAVSPSMRAREGEYERKAWL